MMMKWFTISAVTGTMKLARIVHHSTSRPGKRSCDIAYPVQADIRTTRTVVPTEVTVELKYHVGSRELTMAKTKFSTVGSLGQSPNSLTVA